MTVTYTHEVADCRGFGNFWRLLFRWRGSVYKLVWPDLIVYSFCYYICSAVYRLALDENSKRIFEKIARYCDHYSDLIPVSFVLGFYVSIVIQRWWAQYETLPWPDSLALFISTSIHGHDDRGRLMRRTIVRYVNLAFTITLTMITPRAKKRFPTLDHLVEAGLMTANEKKIFEGISEKTPHPLHFLPLVWAGSVVARARKENRIRDDFAVKTIIDEINNLRGKCGGLLSYDWISIPLVYTQVVTLAVYSFFLSTIMGRQFLDTSQELPHSKAHRIDLDLYFPIFTFLQFFFYMGWLKVAESLVNPFGEDDDDFEVNWLIDRNIQLSYMIVDEMHNEHPELIQDIYWDEVFPQELPYTVAAGQYRRDPPMGSTANIEVPEADQEFLPILDEEPEEPEDHEDREDLEKGTSNMFIKRLGSLRSIGSSAHSGRKNSFISYFQNRFLRNDPTSHEGSSVSVRRSRPRGLNRSASRMSGGTIVSRNTVDRNNTNASFQGSDMFNMSDESLNLRGRNSPRTSLMKDGKSSPFPSHQHAQDDDGPILIKIKRRDAEGREVVNDDSKESAPPKGENINDTGKTQPLVSPTEKPAKFQRLRSQISDASGWDVDKMSDIHSSVSQCSIRTSLFVEGGNTTNDTDEAGDDATTPLMSQSTSKNEQPGDPDIIK